MPRARTTGSLEWVGDPAAPKPTDHWRCRVWREGVREWMRLPATILYSQRAKAETKAHELAERARKGKLPPRRPKGVAGGSGDAAPPSPALLTLAAWGKLWFAERKAGGKKSTRPDESKWNTWVVVRLGERAVAELTRADLEAWVEWVDRQVRAGKLAPKTAALAWGLITSAMQAASAGKVKALRVRDDNPSSNVEPPERGVDKAKVYLYPSEFLALVACEDVPLAVRRAYALTVYLDPRAGEVEALHWEDLDLEHATAHVHRAVDPDDGQIRETKGRAARRFALEPALLPLLRAMRSERPKDRLVFSPWPLFKHRAGQLRAALKTSGVTRADLFASDATRKHMTFHDLRATGITWRAIRGDEPLKIMHAAGHKDLATTMGYVREAENLRGSFGDVFPPLPECLLGGAAARDIGAGPTGGAGDPDASAEPGSMSLGMSQARVSAAKTAVSTANAGSGRGIRTLREGVGEAEGPGNRGVEGEEGGRLGGSGAPSPGRGTFAGTLAGATVADHLRAAARAAVDAGDVEGARAALDALERVTASAAGVVDLAAERVRRAR